MELGKASLAAVKSTYIGTALRIAAQLVGQLFIMRQLGPETVGTFGYVVLINGVLALIIDQGFGWSLVQSDSADTSEVGTVLSRVMLASVLGAVGTYACADLLAQSLGNPELADVSKMFAPAYLLIGVTVVAQARLRAQLRFREIQIATTGAYVVAYLIVGVGLAFAGYGILALLVPWYVQGVIQAAAMYYFAPHPLRLGNPFRRTVSGPLGRDVATINVLNWTVDYSSSAFAGTLGSAFLGVFNAALMLSRTPAQQLVQSLQTILFSTASLARDDADKVKRLYLCALASIAFMAVPMFSVGYAYARPIVHLALGAKWLDASPVFAILSAAMIPFSISSLTSAILTAIGYQRVVVGSQLGCLVLIAAGLAILPPDPPLQSVAIVLLCSYLARAIFQTAVITSSVGAAWAEVGAALAGPLVLGAILAVPLGIADLDVHGLTLAATAWIGGKLCVLAILFFLFPGFFLSPPLLTVATRTAIGRRIFALCRSRLPGMHPDVKLRSPVAACAPTETDS